MRTKYILSTLISLSMFLPFFSHAEPNTVEGSNTVEEKDYLQNQGEKNPYAIALYEPTYLTPFSYVSSFNQDAQADTPDSQKLNHIETKFQFSIKAVVWRNFFNYKNSLNLAYTQLSFWQLYNKSPFFREINYLPEVFFENTIEKPLFGGWQLHFLNVGYVHDSNGRGGDYERSWNRIYLETIFSRENYMVSVRPWYVIPGNSLENNPHIASYLGYERIVFSYKYHQQTFSLLASNLEHINNRASFQATWSFPLIRQFRGYIQAFSGYGESLIDYNHHSDTISVGIALNDWL